MKQSILQLMIIVLRAYKKEGVEINYLGMFNLEVTGKPEGIPEFEKRLLLCH